MADAGLCEKGNLILHARACLNVIFLSYRSWFWRSTHWTNNVLEYMWGNCCCMWDLVEQNHQLFQLSCSKIYTFPAALNLVCVYLFIGHTSCRHSWIGLFVNHTKQYSTQHPGYFCSGSVNFAKGKTFLRRELHVWNIYNIYSNKVTPFGLHAYLDARKRKIYRLSQTVKGSRRWGKCDKKMHIHA